MKIDEDAWPLVIVTVPARPTVESIDTLTDYFERCFARQRRFSLIIDTRAVHSIPDARWRKHLTDAISVPSFRERERLFNVGSATILASAPVRATLTALNWVWRAASPQFAAPDMPSAVEWCVAQLNAAGVPLGDRLRDLRASLSVRAVGSR
jgi:hypothetical protein